MSFILKVNGEDVEVEDGHTTLLEVLREQCNITSVKDGCSPQGQCGCCTVLVDGAPRVSCVTPARRVAEREITTIEGLDTGTQDQWAEAFCATGGSQCGFCTPGIVLRLEGLRAKDIAVDDRGSIDRALAAHICRCTGWQSIREAYGEMVCSSSGETCDGEVAAATKASSLSVENSQTRAELEGGISQRVGKDVVLGRVPFIDDQAPRDALVALLDEQGNWIIGGSLREAQLQAQKIQGRKTTALPIPPIELPEGDWFVSLQTNWVEPAYVEPDAAWCNPGDEPHSGGVNGGAFGAKQQSQLAAKAKELANEYGKPVRVLWRREDIVRYGAKRPPIAVGIDREGKGIFRVAKTEGIKQQIHSMLPDVIVEEVDILGPETSVHVRGAGWVEAAVICAAKDYLLTGEHLGITCPQGGYAKTIITDENEYHIQIGAGEILDETVLRSYCIGAAHMALGWVTSEALHVDAQGIISDRTMRSFGLIKASETPTIVVSTTNSFGKAVPASDAVFASVAFAVWQKNNFSPTWPLLNILQDV